MVREGCWGWDGGNGDGSPGLHVSVSFFGVDNNSLPPSLVVVVVGGGVHPLKVFHWFWPKASTSICTPLICAQVNDLIRWEIVPITVVKAGGHACH